MKRVEDAPGMLRVKLAEHQTSSGSGNNFATALVVAEHAERAAFARMALAVKLRELDAACTARDQAGARVDALARECRVLANECQVRDQDLVAAIDGRCRVAR